MIAMKSMFYYFGVISNKEVNVFYEIDLVCYNMKGLYNILKCDLIGICPVVSMSLGTDP